MQGEGDLGTTAYFFLDVLSFKMTEELIQRFFKKECTAAESIRVSEYLKAHPELIDKYLGEDEWNNIEANGEIPEEFWNNVWADIQKRRRAGAIIVYLKRMTVAACMAALIGLGIYWYAQTEKVNSVGLLHSKVTTTARPVTEHKILTNRSGKMISVALEDSSLVKLSPGSELSYDMPFQKNKRDLWLEGDAYFEVAKDETKPFTVFAAGLATIALGTEFRITTNNKRHNIIVRLYKGKVLIQPATPSLKGWNKNIYLLPGEQMQYDTDKMLVAVEKIINDNNRSLKKPLSNPAAKKAEGVDNHNLSFNSTPLIEVLNQLAKYYSAKIEFDENEINTMSFTGEITKTDSLPIVLNIIAQMNELEVTQQDDGFMIRKLNKK
ncbi:MAG TPA: FecR domain-containing protein [Chitinophagaceae bacterium]|jgi:ferric-dicitrate binding protein FerR (iron transport regulator)